MKVCTAGGWWDKGEEIPGVYPLLCDLGWFYVVEQRNTLNKCSSRSILWSVVHASLLSEGRRKNRWDENAKHTQHNQQGTPASSGSARARLSSSYSRTLRWNRWRSSSVDLRRILLSSHAPPFPSRSGRRAAVSTQSRTGQTPSPTGVRRCRNSPRTSSPAWRPWRQWQAK